MQPVCRAVIDVGTNSVKLLVANVVGTEVRPILETSRQTRLGRGFYQTHRLQPHAISATAEAVAGFASEARSRHASSIRVIATSAAREAANAEELTKAIERASGLKVEIISGEQEADWVFRGATTGAELAQQTLLLLDVGGGSTEFILGQGNQQRFRASFPLGTVRLLEKCPHSDPPTSPELATCRQWLRDFLHTRVYPDLEPALQHATSADDNPRSASLVGTGGTATIIARMDLELPDYDRARIEEARIKLPKLSALARRTWGLALEERKKLVGLPANRADVILGGLVIYEAVMQEFGFTELRVSTRGLRFAAVME